MKFFTDAVSLTVSAIPDAPLYTAPADPPFINVRTSTASKPIEIVFSTGDISSQYTTVPAIGNKPNPIFPVFFKFSICFFLYPSGSNCLSAFLRSSIASVSIIENFFLGSYAPTLASIYACSALDLAPYSSPPSDGVPISLPINLGFLSTITN